jgi:GGDEF domain-containing protein
MNPRIVAGYLVFCILLFVGLLSFSAVGIVKTWNSNLQVAEEELLALSRESSPFFLAGGDFSDPEFRQSIRESFDRRPRLLSMTIYSRTEGALYVLARRKEAAPVRPADANWSGRPAYGDLPTGTTVLRRLYAPGSEGQLLLEGVFTILSREDVFPILRTGFVILLCFFLATLVVLVVTPSDRSRAASAAVTGPRRSPAASSRVASQQSSGRPAGSGELVNPDTGIGWRHHLDHRLKYELERAASFDQDLALVIIELVGSQTGGRSYVRGAGIVRRAVPFADLVFEYGKTGYAVIIPDYDIEQAIKGVALLKRELPGYLAISAGVASRNGRLVSEDRLIEEAKQALKRAVKGGAGTIEAFKADPDRYRDMISHRTAAGEASS